MGKTFETTVVELDDGNLGVPIPDEVLEGMGASVTDDFEMEVTDDGVVIRKVTPAVPAESEQEELRRLRHERLEIMHAHWVATQAAIRLVHGYLLPGKDLSPAAEEYLTANENALALEEVAAQVMKETLGVGPVTQKTETLFTRRFRLEEGAPVWPTINRAGVCRWLDGYTVHEMQMREGESLMVELLFEPNDLITAVYSVKRNV